MFRTSMVHDAPELTDFGIKKVGMIGFRYMLEARRSSVH